MPSSPILLWQAEISRQAEQQRKDLNKEVDRLRKVQQDALSGGGGGAPKGEQRAALFYESMKARDPKQQSSMSWRGVDEKMSVGGARAYLGTHFAVPPASQQKQRLIAWRERATRT